MTQAQSASMGNDEPSGRALDPNAPLTAEEAGLTASDGGRDAMAASFRRAFGKHPAGVAVVTARLPAGPVGVLVSSVASVSAVPPVVSLSIADTSNAGQAVLQADDVAVHLLTAADADIAHTFARHDRDGLCRDHWIEGGAVPSLPTHGPVLFGRIDQRVRAGSATLVTIELDRIDDAPNPDAGALLYYDRGWHRALPLDGDA